MHSNMEGRAMSSQGNISPGLVTRSQFSQNMEGGAATSEHMRTPTRPRNSPAKRAVQKKCTPRKAKS